MKKANNPGTVFMGLTFMALALVLSGFVLMFLWSWFVVPVLGVRQINVVESTGLYLIALWLTRVPGPPAEDWAAKALLWPLVVLFVGWALTWLL
jgi:hypothetical protein